MNVYLIRGGSYKLVKNLYMSIMEVDFNVLHKKEREAAARKKWQDSKVW